MKIKAWQNVKDHAASNLAGLAWERCGHEPITRWEEIREHLQVAWQHLWMSVAALYCARFGHNVEAEEFMHAERDERGRITDIDGAGVDWFCKRCGVGGRSYF